MPAAKACYRELRHYKYQLVQDYTVAIPIVPENDIDTDFIRLTTSGDLTVKRLYAWDGPSGISIDTKDFMRGSLVHDALYQLMRGEYLDYRIYRDAADRLLQRMCIEDGMPSWRAWYVYKGVSWFGEEYARPSPEPEVVIICVPE